MYRYGQEEIDAATRVLRSGHWFRYGDPQSGHLQEAARFEQELARWVSARHACFVSSGTSALMCCYAGLGLGPGDEVIIPGYTWIASATAALAMGVVPVIVDIDESLMIDPDAVERAITPRTRAIDPVHMNGFAADMDAIAAIARRHDLFVIEDACQACGGRWTNGTKLGAIGDMGAYSFNYYKTISCGDGGAFVANHRAAFERGLILHDGGVVFRPHASELDVEPYCGLNLRGSEILAAIMRVQLTRLNGIIADLHAVRARILGHLSDSRELTPIPLNGGEWTGTGGYMGFRFNDGATARSFTATLNARRVHGTIAYRAITNSRHVYSNWSPVLGKHGSYAPARDPFRHPLNAAAPAYSPDMLPRTLAILERTVLVPVNPDWTSTQADDVAEAITASATGGGNGHAPEEPIAAAAARVTTV
jgi:dTDP-4-amino-4,6-dideoxygalactose transaminase